MHLLVVAIHFPSPENPYPGSFIGEQVLALAKRVERITVLSPVPMVPRFMPKFFGVRVLAPEHYILVPNRCQVFSPRYLKAPGNSFLSWTRAQWGCLVEKMIAQFAASYPVSIIHAHTGSVSSWASIQAAKRHKIPCVVTYHGSEVHNVLAHRLKGWKLCRDSFQAADFNLPVSRQLERVLRSSVQPRGKCETMLLGVDCRRFFPADEFPARQQVIFVGSIQTSKGCFDLLQAWARLLMQCPSARLVMIGEDRTKGLFFRQVQSLGLSQSVSLTGPLLSPQVAEMLRESQIFCLPSHNEGTPVSVMEAVACGLPVVATRVGGIPDVVVHGTTGLLVDKGDIQGLANALVSLLCDPSRCIGMGKEAHAFACSYLDIQRTADRLIDLYREMINGIPSYSGHKAVHRNYSSSVGNATEPSQEA